MKTSYLNIFPIYEFNADNSLVDIALSLSKDSEMVYSNKLNGYLRNPNKNLNYSFYNKELFAWFNECVASVKAEHYVDDIDLEITECWGTRTDKFQKHHKHSHFNSILSGVLYLTDHKEAGTEFYYSNPWNCTGGVLDITRTEKKILKEVIQPEIGKLIIFPSNLQHATKPNITNIPRFSIAFNTFVSGAFGSQTTYLSIKPTSVEEAHNTQRGKKCTI